MPRARTPYSQRAMLAKFREWLAFFEDYSLMSTKPIDYYRMEGAMENIFMNVPKDKILSSYIKNHLSGKALDLLEQRYAEYEQRQAREARFS